MDYTKVLIDLIKDEIDGEDYNYSKQDGLVLRSLKWVFGETDYIATIHLLK
jgi:hypothetical protein